MFIRYDNFRLIPRFEMSKIKSSRESLSNQDLYSARPHRTYSLVSAERDTLFFVAFKYVPTSSK